MGHFVAFLQVRGYCYTGGGRKVIRVEVSIDGGKTWTLSKLTHPEKPTEYAGTSKMLSCYGMLPIVAMVAIVGQAFPIRLSVIPVFSTAQVRSLLVLVLL